MGGDEANHHEEPYVEGQMEIDEDQAMEEVMNNYFPDEEMTFEEEHFHPHHGHPRE
jgi:hypothetical protein